MEQRKKYTLRPLPYAYDALEPFIDERTMRIHHDKHLGTYVENLNKALDQYPVLYQFSLERLLYNIQYLPKEIQTAVRNNGGGVYNHNFFFEGMAPSSQSKPEGKIIKEIESQFGSLKAFQDKMKEAALSVFGSGWAWLVKNPQTGRLMIVTTPNQDTTIPKRFIPLLNLDVWEHAYYLKYQNRRADYIDNWFHVVNWDMVNKRFENTEK